MTGAPSAPLSAGTLLYLWGDQVVPAAGRLHRTVTLPSGAVVGAAALAAQVFAVSVWHLSTQRVVRLDAATRRRLLVLTTDDVGVALVGDPGLRAGYEAAILEALTRERTAYGVVRRTFGGYVANPHKMALKLAVDELPLHGLAQVQDAGRGFVTGILKGAEEVTFDHVAIRGTWSDFHRLHEAWRGFRDHDPLGGLLVESCGRAIASREESGG